MIKMLVLDIDGTLTDGKVLYHDNGIKSRFFNVRDGMGIQLAQEAGIVVAVISGENDFCIIERLNRLHIEDYALDRKDKLCALHKIRNQRKNHILLKNIAYIGDDINDLECLEAVGLSACPYDAVNEVFKVCDIHLSKRGGEGCVRELIDIILNRDL